MTRIRFRASEATSTKKDTSAPARTVDSLVLLLGVNDVAASKQFYAGQELTVAKSFGRKYVEFESGSGTVTLALYGRRAAAKDAGVPTDGSGSHRLAINTAGESFSDPDGFVWQ